MLKSSAISSQRILSDIFYTSIYANTKQQIPNLPLVVQFSITTHASEFETKNTEKEMKLPLEIASSSSQLQVILTFDQKNYGCPILVKNREV